MNKQLRIQRLLNIIFKMITQFSFLITDVKSFNMKPNFLGYLRKKIFKN